LRPPPPEQIQINKSDINFSWRTTHSSDFSRQHNVLLIVRSQYRYYVVSKIFQPSKVPIKVYMLPYTHNSFKINISLTQTTPPPPEDQRHPWRGARSTVWEPLDYKHAEGGHESVRGQTGRNRRENVKGVIVTLHEENEWTIVFQLQK
jgi:hypothetical protein